MVTLAVPAIEHPCEIKSLFEQHFCFKYKREKGASRLPVLALYAIYQVLVDEFERYAGKNLSPLQKLTVTYAKKGIVGKIEVLQPNGEVFEAVEVKRHIAESEAMIEGLRSKVVTKHTERYYLLAMDKCEPSGFEDCVARTRKLAECDVIIDGVASSIKYYLQLVSEPSCVFRNYLNLLVEDKAVLREHRMAWNTLVTQIPAIS
jgi:DNA (cytosine-5)-methyltransferase 1